MLKYIIEGDFMSKLDDKDIGVIGLTIIAIASLIFLREHAKEIIIAVVSAIAGIITGRKLG